MAAAKVAAAAAAAPAAAATAAASGEGEAAAAGTSSVVLPSHSAVVTQNPHDYALANQVKTHCTAALIKFKSGHGKLFTQRGRAYMELGQPYFALADFRAAAIEQAIDPTLEILAHEEIMKLPKEQLGFFESADNHLGLLVTPHLGDGVHMLNVPNKGRGIFAKRALTPGEMVIKRSAPWISYPLTENHCANCGGSFGVRKFSCQNSDCHEEYCSRDCRVAAMTTYHNGVCANKAFQALELEVYARLQHAETDNDYNSAAVFLLLMRVYGAALTHRIMPSVLPQLRSLHGRIVFSGETLSTSTLDFYRRLALATETVTSVSYEEFICALAKLTGNIFQEEGSIYAHVPRSMLNHSCEPNVMFTGGELVASRAVAAGEELCTSYMPALDALPYDVRRRELLNRGFNCLCTKCTEKR